MKFEEMQKKLKQDLKQERFIHTMGVVETAGRLADCYHEDMEKARVAALLHDCAKYIPLEERIGYCREHHVEVTEAELANLTLLHAKCGSIRAAEEYGIKDPDILHAIEVHTTGCPKMNLLDKIIYVADYIEPNRNHAPHLNELRKEAFADLDGTVLKIASDTLEYLKEAGKSIDPATYETWTYYNSFFKRRMRMNEESRKMAQIACKALSEKKAEEIKVIDISDVSVIADYFVIASANNPNQIAALIDAVDEAMYKAGYEQAQLEGNQKSSWVLIDYKDVIIHIFSKEDRLFYDLERIWKDGKMIEPEEL